jgi:hypothetical protein
MAWRRPLRDWLATSLQPRFMALQRPREKTTFTSLLSFLADIGASGLMSIQPSPIGRVRLDIRGAVRCGFVMEGSGEQGARVVAFRMLEKLHGWPLLHHLAVTHHD